MRFPIAASLAASLFALACATPASALMQVTIEQTERGVQTSYSGSLNLTGLTPIMSSEPFGVTGTVDPSVPLLGIMGSAGFDAYNFEPASGEAWQPFGSGSTEEHPITYSGDYSGDYFYFAAPNEVTPQKVMLIVPEGYVSGEIISGWFVNPGASLASLGMTSVSFALPNDSIGVTVEASAVPLPAAAPLLAAGLGGLVLAARRRKRG